VAQEVTPEALTPEERETIDRLLRAAYDTLDLHQGKVMTVIRRMRPPEALEALYQTWLASRPPQIVLFCRLMASTYRLCQIEDFNQARAQVTQDLLTPRVPDVQDLVKRVPEILEMLAECMRDNTHFVRTVYVLTQLMPDLPPTPS